jgi:hypothetical protein
MAAQSLLTSQAATAMQGAVAEDESAEAFQAIHAEAQAGVAIDQSESMSGHDQEPSADSPTPMSDGQIIQILQKHPELLENIKEAVAERTGISSQTISDQSIFDRIKADPVTRELAANELRKAGFEGESGTAPEAAGSSKNKKANKPKPAENTEELEQPRLVQKHVPYPDIPSLRDLYTQTVPQENLKRFGSSTFETWTGNAQLPSDLPAGPDYVLGPGDSLTVNMWGGQSTGCRA